MQYYTYVNMHLLCLEWHFFIPFKKIVIFFFFFAKKYHRRSIFESWYLEYFKHKSIIENTIYSSGIVDLASDIQCI